MIYFLEYFTNLITKPRLAKLHENSFSLDNFEITIQQRKKDNMLSLFNRLRFK